MKSGVLLVQTKDYTHYIKPTKGEKRFFKNFFLKDFDCLVQIHQPTLDHKKPEYSCFSRPQKSQNFYPNKNRFPKSFKQENNRK